jgi:hypothetical protein
VHGATAPHDISASKIRTKIIKIKRTTNATFAINVFLNQMFLLLRFGVECIRRGRGVYIEKLM